MPRSQKLRAIGIWRVALQFEVKGPRGEKSRARKADKAPCRLRGSGGDATGHPKRLIRDSIKEAAPFGSAVYSAEEILAAFYLCGITCIENHTIDNSAAYIAGWLAK